MRKAKTKEKPNGDYGKKLMPQVPVGGGQTRMLTLRQAKCAYKFLHQVRRAFAHIP